MVEPTVSGCLEILQESIASGHHLAMAVKSQKKSNSPIAFSTPALCILRYNILRSSSFFECSLASKVAQYDFYFCRFILIARVFLVEVVLLLLCLLNDMGLF